MTNAETIARHPEDACQECGGANVPGWSAPNETWNLVMGGPNGIVCPQCFVKRSEAAGVTGPWMLSPASAQPAPVVTDEMVDAAYVETLEELVRHLTCNPNFDFSALTPRDDAGEG